jgi:DNA polymerase-3 subunit gamma/tau
MKKDQPYVVLARKYRPQGFEEVLGQPAVSVTLKNALTQKKLHHAYLFTGPRGVGKTTMARILAKALNCAEGATPRPCGKCDSCQEIAASSSLDVLEMDAASHTGVDNIRQVIIETVALAPSRDRYKVFIIDEAHMLSGAAFNALLKTLEEPPAHVVFILATTESAKIPATIASRCQRFRFRPIMVETLVEHLGALAKKESVAVEPAALELLAKSADGSLRDAVSLLDQSHSAGGGKVTEAQVREMFGFVSREVLVGVAQAIFARDAKDLAGWLQTIYEEGLEPAQLLRDLRAALESLYLHKLGVGAVEKGWEAVAPEASADALAFLLRRMNRTLEDLKFTDSPRLALELGLFGALEAAFDLEAWGQRLEALEKRLSGGIPAPSAPVSAGFAPPRPISAPASPVAAPRGDVWGAALEAIRKEKISLASTLEKARLVQAPQGPWKLFFQRAFELEAARRGQALIEASLATAAGRPVSVSLELGEGVAAPTEIVDSGMPAESPSAPEGTWKDVTDGAKAEPPAGLSKAQKILGGKVKIIKKP